MPIRTLVILLIVLSAGIWGVGCGSQPYIMKRAQMHMGTVVFLTAVSFDEVIAHKAIAEGFAEVHRLELLLSTWIPESDLSRVNAAAGQKPVRVSPETLMVVEQSLKMARLTEGSFNVVVGPAVVAWNVAEHGRIPSDQELERIQLLVDLSHVRMDRLAGTLFLTHHGMQIDVGGIGKGFAADLVVTKMKESGAIAGVVALSGDIKTFGRMPGNQRFVFGIQHPRQKHGHLLARVELENEAVSTAGDYQQYFIHHGVRYHHILDPLTLKPGRLCQSVTVVALEGVVADGLDTGIFVMGPERGMRLVERLPGVEALIVGQDGEISVSSGLHNRLIWEDPVTENVSADTS